MNPTTEAGWLDMDKNEAWSQDYARGRLAGLREAQEIAAGARKLAAGLSHDFDNGWAAASVQIAQAIGFVK